LSPAIDILSNLAVALCALQIKQLIGKVPGERQEIVANFISSLYKLYVDLNFTYMEINPLVVVGNQVQYTGFSM
jgi:succinyl-CoA synthetase beta subunit